MLKNISQIIIPTFPGLFICTLFLFFLSCTHQQEQKNLPLKIGPKVVEASPYIVPKDSMTEPGTISAGQPKIVNVGLPKVILTNTNMHIARTPKIVLAGIPIKITPGQDSFLLPKSTPFSFGEGQGKRFAGIPEVVKAKDAYIKDQNPQNFSSFSKLQGLTHGNIRCILQDKSGNLWFGTGNGVSKYDGKSFTHFTEKEGLSNNYILCFLEDKGGNLWFGTYGGGVSKYDGKAFTYFTEKEGLGNNSVLSILEDKSGNLWFGTDGAGVTRLSGKSITHFTEKEGLNNNSVSSILEDKSGNIWFGTYGGGVSRLSQDRKSFTHFTEKEGLSSNNVLGILEDKSGNLWFGTNNGGVSCLSLDRKSFTHFTEKEGLSNNTVNSILEDRSGNLWFGTYGGGISRLSQDRKSFTHLTEKEGLSNNIVLNILEDKSGNLWFGTYGGGVSKYGGNSFTHITEKEGLSNKFVLSILEDKSGNLWFGTYGGGVSRLSPDRKSFTHITEKEGLSNNRVTSILEDKIGNLWFGTYLGGITQLSPDGKFLTHFTEKEGLSNNNVLSILEDKSGNLWFGTDGAGVSRLSPDRKSFAHFTEKEGLSSNYILSILEDKSGNLWFGTDGAGVSRLSPDRKSFAHFTEKEGLSNNYVLSILEDKSGNLWFGTDGGGVSMLSPDGKFFTHFTEKEGLCNNNVLSILEDKSGNLWFGTRFGLSKANPLSLPKGGENEVLPNRGFGWATYTYEDGFLGMGVNGGKTICEDKSGTIWIAANDRLTAYHPEGEIPDTVAPNIQLTSLELFNENIAWVNLEAPPPLVAIGGSLPSTIPTASALLFHPLEGWGAKDTSFILGNGVRVGNFEFDGITKWYGLPENLSLAYNNNYLTFNFIGITQKQNKKVKYQYKLEGMDANWNALTDRTEAPYGNLSQGNYSFKVKAMNSEGFWSNEFIYSFTIRPPWWRHWIAYTIYFILLVAGIWFLVWWNGRKLRERANQLMEKVHLATAEIRAQKHHIEEKQKEIIDSITYAKRLQQAILPPIELFRKHLPNSFVLYKPKDIVAGDFYWMETISTSPSERGPGGEAIFIAAADCTGHGVPGAMVSVVCSNALNRAVKEFGLRDTGKILDKVTDLVLETFEKSGEQIKDGMDISLLKIEIPSPNTPFSIGEGSGLHCTESREVGLQWSGANNPLWYIAHPTLPKGGLANTQAEIIEIKADKQPVGKFDVRKPFTTHVITPLPPTGGEGQGVGLTFYLFTDGLPDQFGGPKGKKFMYKRFENNLADICKLPFDKQQGILEKAFQDWKGNLEQVDDITVIGVRV